MTGRHWGGCGPRGRFEFDLPEALLAMRGGPWGADFGPFHFDFGDGPEGWGRRPRGRRRRQFGSSELRLLLLSLIADKPRHGYDLIRAIEELTEGDYAPSPGVIYPTLTMLQDMGFIEEVPGEGSRKEFQATAEGRKHLEENAETIAEIFERIESLGSRRRNAGSPPIGRAVGNLMNALKHRIGRDGIDEDLLHEIATILDDAAQRIERVK